MRMIAGSLGSEMLRARAIGKKVELEENSQGQRWWVCLLLSGRLAEKKIRRRLLAKPAGTPRLDS